MAGSRGRRGRMVGPPDGGLLAWKLEVAEKYKGVTFPEIFTLSGTVEHSTQKCDKESREPFLRHHTPIRSRSMIACLGLPDFSLIAPGYEWVVCDGGSSLLSEHCFVASSFHRGRIFKNALLPITFSHPTLDQTRPKGPSLGKAG